jgi:predicted ABC-type ATPase
MPSNMYIIAGCNGAGKTTASFTILPELLSCNEFVNADEIARGLSPFNPETVAIQAGRIMLNRMEELVKQNLDFAFETTLSTKSYVSKIKHVQEIGYKVTILFFFFKFAIISRKTCQLACEGGRSQYSENGY